MRRLKLKEKIRKRRRVLVFLLLGVLLILFGGISWRTYLVMAASLWNGSGRINLVFRTPSIRVLRESEKQDSLSEGEVFLASVSPQDGSLAVLLVPNGTLIEAIHGYGPYRVEAIWELGELEEGRGGELLLGSLQESLGVPVDAYLSIKNLPLPSTSVGEEEMGKLMANGVMSLFKSEGETNLTRWDLIRLWWEINRIGSRKITMVDLTQTSASFQAVLPDGTTVTKIALDRLDGILNRLFLDEEIRKEDLAIAVLNGTDHPGLAYQAARIITNMGGRVVAIGEEEGQSSSGMMAKEKCQVKGHPQYKDTYTTKKLERIFNCQWGQEESRGQRAQLVLVLKSDYWQKLKVPATNDEP